VSQPLCSFFIPCRRHPQWLAECVESIFKCGIPDTEIIVGVDEDDQRSIEASQLLPVKTMIGVPNRGYHNLHIFFMEMIAIAKGKWIWCWNDDAFFVEGNWAEELSKLDCKQRAIVHAEWHGLGESKYHFDNHSAFPCMPRMFFEQYPIIPTSVVDAYLIESSSALQWPTKYLRGVGFNHRR